MLTQFNTSVVKE